MSKRKTWDEDKIASASKMWIAGVPADEIGRAIGIERGSVYELAHRHREHFPSRNPARKQRRTSIERPVKPVSSTPSAIPRVIMLPDRVTRTTTAGVSITMPRVTFIDGPAT